MIEAHRKLVAAARGLPSRGMVGPLRQQILRSLASPSIRLDKPKLCKIGRTIQKGMEIVALWSEVKWDDPIPPLIDAALDALGCED